MRPITARSGLTLLACAVVLTSINPSALAAEEPSAGEWPVAVEDPVIDGASRGDRWVRTHPMLITALSASMGTPPAAIVEDYFGAFGATATLLWQDGPAELAGWQPGGAANPFITWLRSDGTSAVWNGVAFESSGELMGGLEPGAPGRIGYQVGDEPASLLEVDRIAEAIDEIRTVDPEALLFTNLSIYAPDADAVVDRWIERVDADVMMTTDYFYDHLHYDALERYRAAALRKGVPYWQYLNAYIGAESDGRRLHTESDIRWQAMVGLVYGYTGHAWFIYQADGPKHITATRDGGSILFDGVGDWDAPRTPSWATVATVNRELANLGPTVTQLRSIDVRFVTAVHPDAVTPSLVRPWTPGAGGDRRLTAVSAAPGQAPMDIPIGFFRDADGEHYVMVQNGRHTHSLGADAPPLPGADTSGRIRLEFDFSGAPSTVDRSRLEYLDPVDGRVKTLELGVIETAPPDEPIEGEPPPNERRYAEVALPPGGVFLFKYADTIPFRTGPAPDGVGVVDPGQGLWHLRDRTGVRSFYFGNPGDVPFLGDWDCDGVDTPGLYRRSDGYVYLRNENSAGVADIRFFFGNPGDVPVAGDFDGDGCDTVSIYRPSEARFYIIDRLGSADGGLGTADRDYAFGDIGDVPFAGDFNGDGIDTVGVRRPTTGTVHLRNVHAPGAADLSFTFGDPGDVVVLGDWGGDGVDTVGVFRTAEARFHLRFTNTPGPGDIDFLFGESTFIPIIGHF